MSPRSILEIDQLTLIPGGRALSLDLQKSDSYAVMGPAGHGKSKLMDILCGLGKPADGRILFHEPATKPNTKEYGRRITPQSVCKTLSKRASASRLTQVLSALGLWEVRQSPIVNLDPEHVAACDLLPIFFSETALAFINGQLDCLDPWVRESTLSLLESARQKGSVFIVATNLASIAERMENIIILKNNSPVYAGSVADLLRVTVPMELFVETDDTTTVSTMVEPFSLFVKQMQGGLLIQADKGQELAAKLLTIGYGKVKSVVLKEPTIQDAIRQLV